MNVRRSELKARLSAYLDAVRRGETVVVLDRKKPTAQLTRLPAEATTHVEVTPPARPPRHISDVKGVRRRRAVDVVKILSEMRGDR